MCDGGKDGGAGGRAKDSPCQQGIQGARFMGPSGGYRELQPCRGDPQTCWWEGRGSAFQCASSNVQTQPLDWRLIKVMGDRGEGGDICRGIQGCRQPGWKEPCSALPGLPVHPQGDSPAAV